MSREFAFFSIFEYTSNIKNIEHWNQVLRGSLWVLENTGESFQVPYRVTWVWTHEGGSNILSFRSNSFCLYYIVTWLSLQGYNMRFQLHGHSIMWVNVRYHDRPGLWKSIYTLVIVPLTFCKYSDLYVISTFLLYLGRRTVLVAFTTKIKGRTINIECQSSWSVRRGGLWSCYNQLWNF